MIQIQALLSNAYLNIKDKVVEGKPVRLLFRMHQILPALLLPHVIECPGS